MCVCVCVCVRACVRVCVRVCACVARELSLAHLPPSSVERGFVEVLKQIMPRKRAHIYIYIYI